ncbi:unnamed protein product [Brachionus calyciflorus]|uniref:Mediator of RNA polymerase II transcription subunit 14 n=1 Tax=Brachionus calyciflorus TaxID=104777 RepID=A0A813SIG1_9BILA|nr:unnamed protein product [Brachionus calyciflorus]
MTSINQEANVVANPFFNPNQERYESLAFIIQQAVQQTYNQLTIMIETFSSLANTEKKIKILAFACKTRQLFMRIYALVKFIKTAHINVSNILSFLEQQSFIFVNTADYLYHLANVKLVNARLPSFSILSSVDVLTLGTYPRLPSSIKDRIIPPEKITDDEKEKTLETLNRIIQCRLALSELPSQLKNFKIDKGYVEFEVKNEFEIKLTLISDNFKLPWRLLKINFLVKDSRDPNKVLVHNLQVTKMHQYLQERLNENQKPFVEIYNSLHFFVQSLQLEVLYEQMCFLLNLSRFYKITKYEKCKMFTVEYWLEYPNKNYTFTICVGENSDFLQTTHNPLLHWRDHKNIDLIFKSGELMIEKIVHQIIKFRSKKRLMEVQFMFEQFPYCKAVLIEDKPAVQIQFIISNFQKETLWIMIDYYKGQFQCIFPHSILNLKLKNSLEECLNSDFRKLEPFLLNLRIWLLLRRCETIIRSYGFRCHEELHITSFASNDLMNMYNKLEKNKIFVELKKQEKIFIVITIKSKEELYGSKEEINWYENPELLENENSLAFNYYILNIGKCKYDGELDQTKPFLKLLSLSHFKRNTQLSLTSVPKNKKMRKLKFDEEMDLIMPLNHDNCLIEFVNMVYYIEDFLPYLSLMKIFNKQNVVTQNIHSNPSLLPILCLNLLSVPTVLPIEFKDFNHLDSLSKDLMSSLVSFTIRQRQFKDYLNSGLPTHTFTSVVKQAHTSLTKFQFILELTFNHGVLNEMDSKQIEIFTSCIEANNLDNLYQQVKLEWISMCRIYSLVIECKKAFVKYPDLAKQMRIKKSNFKRLIIQYGSNLSYLIQFQWNKETKNFEIFLDVDHQESIRPSVDKPEFNYHNLFLNEIRKYFQSTKSVVNLVQILNYSCVCTYGLAKLANIPKFYSKVSNQPILPNCGFMLNIYSLTHFKLVYYSKYALDVHIKPNGLVSIRDDSFGLTDINSGNEDIHPIQFLSGFLKLFLDDSVQELLRRRSSLVEDDNPGSPTLYHNQQPMSNNQQQAQSHVFLPPTSPAIQQPRTNQNIPAPSPGYFVQSPGMSGPTSNAPIPQSPGFPNFGSPAIPHSSPSTNHQIINNQSQQQQQHSMSIQSPSNFMSPAPASQPPSFSNHSPANFSELSLQSPMAIKSPFVGPSPNTNIPSITSNYGGYNKDIQDDQKNPKSVQMSNYQQTSGTSSHQYKKCHSASIPIYLSENGFLKMITINPDTNYSPLELFLSSYHLKKVLIKTLNNDNLSFQIKNHEANAYKTHLLEFQFIKEIMPNYQAFSIQFIQTNPDIQVDTLQRYLNHRILSAPYRSASVISYFNLISVNDVKMLREFSQLLEYEMNPGTYKTWRIKFAWTIPGGYNMKSQKQNVLLPFFMTSQFGFQRKDKFYFLLYLMNMQRVPGPSSVGSLLLMISYEPSVNNFQYEVLKPINELNLQTYHAYDIQINSLVNQAKQKDPSNHSLLSIINEIICSLPNAIGTGMPR